MITTLEAGSIRHKNIAADPARTRQHGSALSIVGMFAGGKGGITVLLILKLGLTKWIRL